MSACYACRDASRVRLLTGFGVTAIGTAHFVWPARFEPLNRTLGFTKRTLLHVYVNGAFETVIGLTLVSPITRKLNLTVSMGYPAYLAINAIRARTTS